MEISFRRNGLPRGYAARNDVLNSPLAMTGRMDHHVALCAPRDDKFYIPETVTIDILIKPSPAAASIAPTTYF